MEKVGVKELTRQRIRDLKVGSALPIKNMNAYPMLVDLYCEGEPFTIDLNKGMIERESEDFTQRRMEYARRLSSIKESQKPDKKVG